MQDFLQQSESLVGPEMIKHSKLTKNGKEEELTRFFYIKGCTREFLYNYIAAFTTNCIET